MWLSCFPCYWNWRRFLTTLPWLLLLSTASCGGNASRKEDQGKAGDTSTEKAGQAGSGNEREDANDGGVADESAEGSSPAGNGIGGASRGGDGNGGASRGGTENGGSGEAGTSPVPDPVPDEEALIVPCSDDFRPDPEVKNGVVVDGNQFSDRCTSQGNLVEFSCDAESVVTSTIEDCDGRCVDGTCENLCLDEGTEVRISRLEEDGRILVENTENDQAYLCLLATGSLETCVDAFADSPVEVSGIFPLSCTGGTVGTIAVLPNRSCQFQYCTTTFGSTSNPSRPPLANGAVDCPTWGDSIETVDALETGELRLLDVDLGQEYICEPDLDILADIPRDPELCLGAGPATIKSLSYGTDENDVAYYCTDSVPYGFSTCFNSEAPCKDANCSYTNCRLYP